MDRVRWGILATGKIARTFAADLARTPGAELRAVGSRSLDTAQAFTAEFGSRDGTTRAYGSYHEVVADPDVDVVYVATPHVFHVDNVRLCFEHLKPVLCEKPVTLNAADAELLAREARGRGLFYMEAMWMRCNPVVRGAVDLVASGAIGPVTHLTADFGFVPSQGPEHRLFDPALGASALLDIGIYPLTLASLFLGTPTSLTSVGSLSDRGIDLSCSSLLTYDRGATASLTCTMLAHTPGRAAVSGHLGNLEFSRRFHCPTGYTVTTTAGTSTYEQEILGNGYVYEIEEVQRCLREGLTESPLVPIDDTLSLMRQLDEIRTQIGTSLPGDQN